MPDVTILQEGEEPKDPGNFVLVEEIPAPRGGPRYRVVARGLNDEGPISFDEPCDSLAIARDWALELTRTWRSRPPIYLRHPLEWP